MTTAPRAVGERLRRLVDSGGLDLPPVGAGRTGERLAVLARIAAADLALGRLAEAHLDAVTILREAGREPDPGATYGVWASDAPHARLLLESEGPMRVVRGSKAFCTGAGLVDRALVTVHDDESVHLVSIEARPPALAVDTSAWISTAFAETNTATIAIDRLEMDDDQFVGPPGWYLDRIGFWHGALAPAACWAGGAIGLVDHCVDLAQRRTPDDHLAAHLGALDAARWELGAILRAGGDDLDARPHDPQHALTLAHRFRSSVERVVSTILDHAVRSQGPRLLAHDAWASQRVAELQLYVRQHHDARDHAVLGRVVVAAGPDDPAGAMSRSSR